MHRTASFLIDATGNLTLNDVSDPVSADSIAIEAVTNTGSIEWLVRSGHVRVRLRPAMTSGLGYARLTSWLASMQPERVLLSYYASGAWEYEFYRSTFLARRRLDRLMEDCSGSPFNTVRRQIRSLRQPAKAQGVLDGIDYWRAHRESFDSAECMRTLDQFFESRWVLLDSSGDGVHRLSEFGCGNSPYVAKWMERNVGAPLIGAPDAAYSRSCVTSYRFVEDKGEPYLEDVDALAVWPGRGYVRSRYHRLMLPFKSKGKTWLLSSSTMNADIDLIP